MLNRFINSILEAKMTDSNDRKNTIMGLVIIIILGAGIFLLVMMDSNIGKAIIMFNKEIAGARIHLIGKVTDMNNRELEDVTLKLEFNRPKDFGLKSEHLRETRTINGIFAIEKNHYTSVSISFYKPGYRIEHITFYTSEAANTPLSAIQENCHIKLREIGTLAALVKGHAHLEYDEERQLLTVFDLSEIADGKLNRKELKLGEAIPLKKYLRLDFERDSQGEIILQEQGQGKYKKLLPKTFYLRFVSSDPDDGLIPADTTGPDKMDITWLTQAPEGEYAAKDFEFSYKEGMEIQFFFYIKCGKYYGKGLISVIEASNNVKYKNGLLFVKLYINKKQNDLNLNSD
jgi:hypothetical protein